MINCSLITVAHHHNEHLAKLLRGLLQSSCIPNEIIIVDFDGFVELPPLTPVGIINVTLNTDNPNESSFAAARNAGAKIARGEKLIFLDVDCIPSTNFVKDVIESITNHDGLTMGTTKYLSSEVEEYFSDDELQNLSTNDPTTVSTKAPVQKSDDYALFSGKCFGISRENFNKTGGFNERQTDRGAVDNDFGSIVKAAGIPFLLSNAKVYHHPHTSHSPSANYVEDILLNNL